MASASRLALAGGFHLRSTSFDEDDVSPLPTRQLRDGPCRARLAACREALCLTPSKHAMARKRSSVVIADLEAMRPGFLPRAFGTDFTQVVYRAIVRAPNGERGVYFVRSDADDWTMSVFGSIFSNFNFNLARCVWAGRDVMRDAAALVLEQANDPSSRPEIQKREWLATPSLGDDRERRFVNLAPVAAAAAATAKRSPSCLSLFLTASLTASLLA